MSSPSAGWRVVYLIQQLISWVAPPLHSLHWKIFALLLVGLFLPALYFLWQVRVHIERSHLVSTEQGMVDTALVVADSFHSQPPGFLGRLPQAHEIRRRVFNDQSPDLRIVLYDAEGGVLSDTEGVLSPGTPAGEQSDIRRALRGKHGTRWERDPYRQVVTLFSSVPVFQNEEVVGVVSVIKPTSDVRLSIWKSLRRLAPSALLAFGLAAGVSYALSSYLTRVITDMAARARRISEGESGVRLETWTKSELGDLARALEAMRVKLEGRAYIEEMASTLSHELKTPLSSIRGATEIIEDSAEPEVRQKFLTNIRAEVDRLTGIVNNLLALSRIETRPVTENASCLVNEICTEMAETFRPRAEMLGLKLETQIAVSSELISVEADALRQILTILLDNACTFTPSGKIIRLDARASSVQVSDEGCGIEPALQARVFERFFTTVNPLTGRRGTGLGLAIAQSLVVRAHGQISLQSQPGRGTTVTVQFSPV